MAERGQLVVHAGMHKTGSTAIQEVFGARAVAGVDHPGGPRSNLSDTVLLLFAEGPLLEKFHAARVPHLSRRALMRQRAREETRLTARLARARAPIFLFSAEDIAAPDFDVAATARMADFLDRSGRRIDVRAYVRAPISFMQSAFQQRVKQDKPGAADLDARTLWPCYRARFEKLDTVFGRDRVHLRAFDPSGFPGGDVVADFAAWLGVTLPEAAPLRANDGLSREAMAVAWCRLADRLGADYPDAARAAHFRATPARALTGFGQGRFAFSEEFLGPALEAHRADLNWMETRLGRALPDRAPPAEGLAGVADFEAISEEVRAALAAHLDTLPPPPSGMRRALARVRRQVRQGLGLRGRA